MARLHHHLQNAFIPHPGNDYRPHALRPHVLRWYVYIIVAVKIVTVGLVILYSQPARLANVTPTAVVALTNQARKSNHVPALRTNALLTKAAEAKASDMANRQYFAHISPAGATPWAWFKQAGYSYTYAGENLALDFIQAEDIVSAWLKSPTHRRNLLSMKYKDIGVAVTDANINGVKSLVVVQMFGAPLPPPVTKPAKTPVQTPSPTATKKQLATAPAPTPVVLGETVVPPAQPAVPTLITPAGDTVLRSTRPEVIGQAEPGAEILLLADGVAAGRVTVPPDGTYTVTPDQPLANGPVVLQTQAVARGLTSQPTTARTVTVDSVPPVITLHDSYILPSALTFGAYDVGVAVSSDAADVTVIYGGVRTVLLRRGDLYVGTTIPSGKVAVAGVMSVRATDPAGNQVDSVLADPELFTTGVVAPSSGPIVNAVRVIFYSRTFLIGFLIALLILSTLNVVVHWQHQHHPTIIGTLLVLYLTGTLLLV